jgi:Fe-S cluster biosynthesis and repair protein YggX
MEEAKPLQEFFRVGERFQRSVNLAADYGNSRTLNDYIITSLSVSVLSRIGLGLKANSNGRAWSITGPYGAGKSAAILFMAKVLGYPASNQARRLLESKYPELLEDLYVDLPGLQDGGYVIVPVVGSHEPISWTLLAGLVERLSSPEICTPDLQKHVDKIRGLYNQARSDQTVHPTSITEAIQHSAQIVRSTNPPALGLLIVYDELGRALEYAALHPEHSDIGILQTIAELATRSGDTPVGLITILHQAFEHYAANLSPVQQREWSKVQGRFEDIGFLESPGELLRLIDKAICPVQPVDELLQVIDTEVEQGKKLDILPRDLHRQEALQILAGCAPLHPTVALILGRLFRSRLSQNERSLFAFLSSGEPYGFQEYLAQETWSGNRYRPFYRIDNLYDYILGAMGSVLYTQAQGRRWAEIEDALDRLHKDAGGVETRLVKTIGLLGLLGDQRYLKASAEVLTYALTNGHGVGENDVREALERLEDEGIAVYRHFQDAYSLWQGSDIDLNERFEAGLAQIDRSQRLASLLQTRGRVKPYVAKRHLHQTGTLRYFVPWTIELEDLEEIGNRPFGAADGAVVFVLGTNGMLVEETKEKVLQFSALLESPRRELIFFAIPRDTQGIRETFEEMLAWEWAAENTPELEGDSIARRELAACHLAAQERLGRATARCFETTSAYQASTWIWKGEEQRFNSARALSAVFSQVCGQAYKRAPIVQNELINRRKLSSAASAARRSLVERMLTHPTEAKLGMEGYPPEVSLYLSVLESSGLHHQEGEIWVFGPPQGKDLCNVTPLWRAIDDFLTTTEEKGPYHVTELYEILRQPPFGIKDGLLPIYVVVALLHWKAELALYEEGSFVPKVRPAECERLMRVPERFSLQRYRLDESRKRMLYKYSVLFGEKLDPGDVTQLTAVRPILAFANQLPRYAQLTNSLSEGAIAVRDALFSAREPQRLLFETLPQALSFEMAGKSVEEVEQYFSHLKRVLVELQRAYEQLLISIQSQLLDVLLLPSDLEVARREIAPRAHILENWVADLQLKAFVSRLGDAKLPQREWLESVAACLANKPPSKWNDGDVLSYRVALADIAGQFRRTEEVALVGESAEGNGNVGRVIRLGVTDALGHEQREIVYITPDQKGELEKTVRAIGETLHGLGADRAMRVMAVAELARRIMRSASSLEENDE